MAKRRQSQWLVAVAGAVVVSGLAALGASADSRAGVTIQTFQFRPSPERVAPGATVTWTNHDEITHTVTSGTPDRRDGRFSVELNGKGATGSITFPEPGVYPYFCDRHQSMRGEIRVN